MILRTLDLVHRWLGGLIGLVLAVLGLSGTILLHKTAWIGLPHSNDAQRTDVASLAAATERMLADPGGQPESIIFASDNFGLHQLRVVSGGGSYANQDGATVTSWASQWERPELWIFDLHHHLFTGDVGETVAGIAGLSALVFIVTGAILWWRTRRTFRFRLWPKRFSRPAILMHHRDLGIVIAPLLLLTVVTGLMMIFRPFAAIIVAPFSPPAEVWAAITPPADIRGGMLAPRPDWLAIFTAARERFPDGEFRILVPPRRPGDPIRMRMRRADEWLPNGRSLLAFDAADGRLIFSRDALETGTGAQVFNAAYPLHSAKVGGLIYRLVMTLSGVAMTLLGTLTVWTFWFRRRAPVRSAPSGSAEARPSA